MMKRDARQYREKITRELLSMMPRLLRDFPALTARYYVGLSFTHDREPPIILETDGPVDTMGIRNLLAGREDDMKNLSICYAGHLGVGRHLRFPHVGYPLVAKLPRGAITGRFLVRTDEWGTPPRLTGRMQDDFRALGISDYRLASAWGRSPDDSLVIDVFAVFRDEEQWMAAKMRY